MCLLEKHDRKKLRKEDYNDFVMQYRDCDEALKAEFDIEIKSEAFCFNHNLSIKGIT